MGEEYRMNRFILGLKTFGVMLVLLLVSACKGPAASDMTPTPLDPGMFPPPGTPQGVDQHTPVITPVSDGAATAVGNTGVAGSVTLAPNANATITPINGNANANTGANTTTNGTTANNGAFAPTTLPNLGGNTNGAATGNTNTTGTNGTTGGTGGTTGTTNCAAPAGWVAYTVQAGDTLSTLADNLGVSLASVASANCIGDTDVITVGQTLYLPSAAGTGNAGTGNTTTNNGTGTTGTGTTGAGNTATGNTGTGTTGTGNTGTGATTGGTNGTTVTVPTGTFIGSVLVDPATILAGGEFQINSGTTITFRANGVGNATQVTFYLLPVNAAPGTQATMLGVDTNVADGISVLWTVPTPNLRANVWAVTNTGTATQPIVIGTR